MKTNFLNSRISHIPIILLLVFMFGTHILLPLDRGFPNVMVLGYMIDSSILISAISFVICMFVVGTPNLHGDMYLKLQYLLIFIFIIGALLSKSVLTSIRVTLVYFMMFIVNYAILNKIIKIGYKNYIINTICFIGVISAIAAVAEGIFHYQLPWHREWVSNYNQQDYLSLNEQQRVGGTLGNPILLTVAMMLLIPFVTQLKSRIIKFLLSFLFLFSAILSVSKTMFLFLIVYLIGFSFVYRYKFVKIIIILLLSGYFVSLYFGFSILNFDISQLWNSRLFDVGVLKNDTGISMRAEALGLTFAHIRDGSVLAFLFGNGSLADVEIGNRISQGFNTIDNTFMTLFLNSGLVGLSCFTLIYYYVSYQSRRLFDKSMVWYVPLGMLLSGWSFVFYNYSSFNILLVSSFSLLMMEVRDFKSSSLINPTGRFSRPVGLVDKN